MAGCVGFILTGWNEMALPQYSIGYIYWPAFLAIVVSSMLFAPLGAWLAHRLSAEKLKRYFALVLFVLGLKMLLT